MPKSTSTVQQTMFHKQLDNMYKSCSTAEDVNSVVELVVKIGHLARSTDKQFHEALNSPTLQPVCTMENAAS